MKKFTVIASAVFVGVFAAFLVQKTWLNANHMTDIERMQLKSQQTSEALRSLKHSLRQSKGY